MGSDGVPAPNLDKPGQMLSWASERINEGWGLGKFIKSGIGLLTAGVFVLVFDVLEAITGFITNPLRSASQAVGALFSGLLTSPLSILVQTAAHTAQEIQAVFVGFLGVFAFPVGVASVLLALYLINLYLEEPSTSDLFPGSFTDVDVPDVLSSFIPDPGVQEEGETDQSRD